MSFKEFIKPNFSKVLLFLILFMMFTPFVQYKVDVLYGTPPIQGAPREMVITSSPIG